MAIISIVEILSFVIYSLQYKITMKLNFRRCITVSTVNSVYDEMTLGNVLKAMHEDGRENTCCSHLITVSNSIK